MKRLTTDHPEGNFETALNYVYSKNGVAYLLSDGEKDDVPVHEWAKAQCLRRGCVEFPGTTLEEIDEEICGCAFDFPSCPVFLAYTFACQAVRLRDRLMQYEDTGLDPASVRRLASPAPNAPLTLDELREMGDEWVWIELMCTLCGINSGYYIKKAQFSDENRFCFGYQNTIANNFKYSGYGTVWLAYRRKPEEDP